ncbi:MAG: bifunctional folylpolyglutamate synthase/dihydrofolate synthase [Acidobacteriaceae bacterium]|nr:bifunctional folylpolyglutamate synthase/dihydrofolate synthase [Acidobacteriaceae bacterium]MBV9294510.1 bifunctional folylpolyglutamate synthase/dihydrofolate synthase [Acidobacteriaceae bacterium]MBV9766118.1 bifunctional folylpolyglutamate synthase/dihydrofolate synthase [Acidobacteriaceae bacterium]
MSYSEAVRYLYSLGNELKIGAKFGLERIQALLAELGNPESGQRFVHVAGTNGKGSTCAMIANVLRHAGFRTGLYTSPHLIEPTERIQLCGSAVSEREFARLFEMVHAAAERLDSQPSYFETVTAMALVFFQEQCDISVLEVGLGGRLDATNVVSPVVCAITPIAFDHESFLGNTLEAIASEKAGILKRGVSVVVAKQAPEAEVVIAERAHQLGCELLHIGDAPMTDIDASAHGSSFSLGGERYECGLPGRHQMENAATAILVCRWLGVSVPAIQAGLASVRWPGRLELVSREPDFILDGAHNPAGAGALAAYIREFCGSRLVWIVYGAMRDKAIDEVTSQLFPLADRLIVTAPSFPRALRPEAILEMSSHANAVIAETVGQAIEMAQTASKDAVVFFTGSLFLVGEARGLLHKIGVS